MCKDVEGSTEDCKFKIHNLKCKKGHPLHLSRGKTFMCCRSGCKEIIFFDNQQLVDLANKQIDGY